MAKIKEHYLGEMSQHEIDVYLYNKQFRDMEYEEWLKSEEYMDLVNSELEDTKIIYSASDVANSLNYGVSAVQVTVEEVGRDVYGKLLNEKVFEYLNHIS